MLHFATLKILSSVGHDSNDTRMIRSCHMHVCVLVTTVSRGRRSLKFLAFNIRFDLFAFARFPHCQWNNCQFAARRPRVRSHIITGFFRIFSKFPKFLTECHIRFSHHYDVNIIAIFVLSVDIFIRLFSLKVRHYRFLTKICNAFLSSYCIFLG